MNTQFRTDGQVTIELVKQENDIDYYSVSTSCYTDKIHVEWSEQMTVHYGVWHPMCGRCRQMPQWFCAQKAESCFYKGAPVIATLTADGKSGTCVAIKDTITPMSLGFFVDDFNGNHEVVFTVDIDVKKEQYQTIMRIDRSCALFSDAIHDVAVWWNEGMIKSVPDDAYAPLYSSWYNFHQDPEQKELTEELKLASELGFRTFILDDGWQIDGKGTKDYLLSGDWHVSEAKFPDFRKFADDVHSFGMKFMLWFAVPFVGYRTDAYVKFREKLLFKEDGFLNAGILDIRYPDVRKYIRDRYTDFIKKYGIDGLKLDFIDNFKCHKDTPEYNSDMDCETVEGAVIVLLTEIKAEISAIKRDFLYEYRQNYVGPSILEFGNMIRVADCAFDSMTNRIGVADLRMMTDNTAVHSDMLLWSPDETPVNCAMQLLNVMFSAVQISVLLRNSSYEQRDILKAFISYATKNRDVLLKGRFKAKHPELNYTVLSSESREKSRKISVMYAEEPYDYDGMAEDVWNGCFADELIIRNEAQDTLDIMVTDFFGNVVNRFSTEERIQGVTIPAAGMVRLEKQQKTN